MHTSPTRSVPLLPLRNIQTRLTRARRARRSCPFPRRGANRKPRHIANIAVRGKYAQALALTGLKCDIPSKYAHPSPTPTIPETTACQNQAESLRAFREKYTSIPKNVATFSVVSNPSTSTGVKSNPNSRMITASSSSLDWGSFSFIRNAIDRNITTRSQ